MSAVDHRECEEKDDRGNPAAVETIAAARKPEWAHRVALNDGRVAVYSADREAEDKRANRLPREVQSPTYPESAGAQVSHGEQQAEDDGEGDAGIVRAGLECLHDRIEQCKAKCRAIGPNHEFEALETVAPKGYLLGQRGEGKEQSICKQPSP